MKVTTLREIFKNKEAYYDQEVTVGGWVRSNRDSKQFGFLTISDGTFFTPLQVVSMTPWRTSRRWRSTVSARPSS